MFMFVRTKIALLIVVLAAGVSSFSQSVDNLGLQAISPQNEAVSVGSAGTPQLWVTGVEGVQPQQLTFGNA